MDSRTLLLHDEHSVVDNWRMEFFDNLPTCIQGGVDPQAPFQLKLSKISGSLVVGSSTFDSLLDLLDGGVLLYAYRCMKDVDIYKYPTEKLRVQPVGITVFATLMTTLGLLVLFNATKQLFSDGPSENMNPEKLLALYVIMVTATFIKLGLEYDGHCKQGALTVDYGASTPMASFFLKFK